MFSCHLLLGLYISLAELRHVVYRDNSTTAPFARGLLFHNLNLKENMK